MPLLGMGSYRVVVSAEQEEVAAKTFGYFPSLNYAWILSIAAVVAGMFLDIRKHRKAHPAWWLSLPAMLGLTLHILLPKSTPFGAMLLAELGSLAALLGLLGLCRKGRRWRHMAAGLLANTWLTCLALGTGGGDSGSLMQILVAGSILSAVWFLPAALAVLLLRSRYTFRRYFKGMLLAWLIVTFLFIGLLTVLNGMPDIDELLTGLVIMLIVPLPFILGLLLLLGLNPWCREQFLLAMRLERAEDASAQKREQIWNSIQWEPQPHTAEDSPERDDPWVVEEQPRRAEEEAEGEA